MRCTFLPKLTGFRIAKGQVLFFTVSPDRRHSALLLRLMRARTNDPYLLPAGDNTAREWRRKFASANEPANVYETAEVTINYDRFPAVADMIRLTAQDPLATVMHFNLCMKISVPLLLGLRSCLHCPQCSREPNFDYFTTTRLKGEVGSAYDRCGRVPCQDEFGSNTRTHGGTFGLCDGLTYVQEHQANDTPHAHGVFTLATPYRSCSLHEISEKIEKDILSVTSIKRYTAHMCREEHFDQKRHKDSLPALEEEWKQLHAGAPHVKLSHRAPFMQTMSPSAEKAWLWGDKQDQAGREEVLAEASAVKKAFEAEAQEVFSRMQTHWHPEDEHGRRVPQNYCRERATRGPKKKPKQEPCSKHHKGKVHDEICKHDFPRKLNTKKSMVICQHLARTFGLKVKGRRNSLSLIDAPRMQVA